MRCSNNFFQPNSLHKPEKTTLTPKQYKHFYTCRCFTSKTARTILWKSLLFKDYSKSFPDYRANNDLASAYSSTEKKPRVGWARVKKSRAEGGYWNIGVADLAFSEHGARNESWGSSWKRNECKWEETTEQIAARSLTAKGKKSARALLSRPLWLLAPGVKKEK